ncbi:MAG: hypothetical protein Kow00128_17240 [Deltaproteobacteria bacterium]
MNTYLDFLTHVKGVEYILSLMAIVGFILFLEILKPAPFRTVARATRDDLEHLKREGARATFRTILRICAAPFLGLAYVLMLPFLFAYALGMELLGTAARGFERLPGLARRSLFFGWRPMEAYFGGRKKIRAPEKPASEEADDDAGDTE